MALWRQDTLASDGGVAGMIGIDCFESESSAYPWTDRGRLVIISGIVAGLCIDLVYTNIFRALAFWLAGQQNVEKAADYDNLKVRLLYPFEWAAFMAYFILAAALIPFAPTVSMYLVQKRLSGPAFYSVFHCFWLFSGVFWGN